MMICAVCVFFAGCTSEITVDVQKSGAVNICVFGEAGDAFARMILSSTGGEENTVLDSKEIGDELVKSGFTNVDVKSKSSRDLTVKISDEKQSSFLFTSGLLKSEKDSVNLELSRKNLEAFYDSADDQIVQILDLFLAPIFNDEEMSEEEYIETINSVYGKSCGKEIAESKVKITINQWDGKQEVFQIPVSRLLTKGCL